MTGQTYGEKVVSQKGNSPKQEYKVPKLSFSVIKEVCQNTYITRALAWRLPLHNVYVIIRWF